jgi:hypothetical protein
MGDSEWFSSPERQVRREPLFDEQISGLAIEPERLDDILYGLEISLSRHPEVFPKLQGTEFSFAELTVFPDTPKLRVFFNDDPFEVRLICVEWKG